MRGRLRWDVVSVIEHDEMRRLPDCEHYRLARQLGRTLVTLDRDYLDDRRFPPGAYLRRAGRIGAGRGGDGEAAVAARSPCLPAASPGCGGSRLSPAAPGLPLLGRKLLVHPDWAGRR